MAIEHTRFIGTTMADNQAEVYTWLRENASDYFDEITNDTENTRITCSAGGTAVCVIVWDSAAYISLYFKGTQQTEPHHQTGMIVQDAYRTGKGIALRINSPGTADGTSYSNYRNWTFFLRSNEKTLATVQAGVRGTSTSFTVLCIDCERNYHVYLPWQSFGEGAKHGAITCLTPTPLGDGGTYADGLYYASFCELYNGAWQNEIIEMGGKRYVYNGLFCLEE